MAAITTHEQEQVSAANASGLTPVVFVHGLWLLPSSWDRWRAAFEEAGFATLAPGWPDDPETVAEANANPEVVARHLRHQCGQSRTRRMAGPAKRAARLTGK